MVKKGARGGGQLVEALAKRYQEDPLVQQLDIILAKEKVDSREIQELLDTKKESIDLCLKTLTQTFPQLDDIVQQLLSHADENGVIPQEEIIKVLGNVNEQEEKPELKPQEADQKPYASEEQKEGGKSGRKGKPAKKAPKAGRKVKGGANVNLSTDFAYIANTSGLQITPDPVAQASSSTMTSIANYASPFSSGATTTNPLMDLPPAYSTTLNPSLVGGGKKPRKPAAKAPKRKTKGGEK
jgi:hypothetical protein